MDGKNCLQGVNSGWHSTLTETEQIGCADFDRSIRDYVQSDKSMWIGQGGASRIREKLCSNSPLGIESTITIKGRNFNEPVPRDVQISSSEIAPFLGKFLEMVVTTVKVAMDKISSDLVTDRKKVAITLTGSGANLKDLGRLLTDSVSATVAVASNGATDATARRLGIALEKGGNTYE